MFHFSSSSLPLTPSCAVQQLQGIIMEMNRVGKFETLKIMNEFDQALIEKYGVNMTDAHITRYEALTAYEETGSASQAAALLAEQRGFKPLAGSVD
ncbi:hypothetical protein [Sulfuricystis multivorans]|uniref:hypothetical protein n=1 Tax=Sulfuricystis multivorans TaxID=2211108 RepID=UPI000F81DAB2|nr:hypothetical protein [Sulfuricystis multivorans]